MSTPPEMRDLARLLLAYEAFADKTPQTAESATLRVYEKLRQSLSAIAGAAAFESLAFRALMQAKSETKYLWAVQVAADGALEGFGECEPLIDNDMDSPGEEGIILIARLLNLLHIFLGEALMLSLLRDAWPDAAFDDRSSGNRRKS
jgi:hypothetical protein